MPTFTPSGGQPLLVRGTVQENFDDKMPLTSRYAWPRRSESSLSTSSFPNRNSKNPFFARHNPHPQRVRHLKGLLDVPICTVIDYTVCTPTVGTPIIDQMRQRPLRSSQGLRLPINLDGVKEKAVLSVGLVPITETWREELRKLTEASGIKSKNRYTNTTSYQVPPSRQGSRQGERPPPSRGGMLPPSSRNGEKPPSRNGEIPPSRNGMKPPSRMGQSRQGDRPSLLRQELPLQHIAADTDSDLTMYNMLVNILQPTHPDDIKSWLVHAPDREKEIVLDMIRAVCTSDNEYREGYNDTMKSVMYDDQLLQHESSLELDEIQKYNETKKKEREELERKRQEKEEAEKPRTPRTAGSQGYTQYQWTSPGCKPSSPFIATEKKKEALIEQNKPRPGTAEAEIEEIRSRLQSRSSPRVFTHQRNTASRHSARPQPQQSVYIPPAECLEPAAIRPPSHQSIKSQQSVIRSILSYKPQQNN